MNKRCELVCPGAPCALLRAADSAETRADVVKLESEMLFDKRVQADANIMELDLGIDLGSGIGTEAIRSAFDQGYAADGEYHDHLAQNAPLMKGDWPDHARQQAARIMDGCSGPVHGIRVPFLGNVIRTPGFIGKDHCGASNEDFAETILDIARGQGIIQEETS